MLSSIVAWSLGYFKYAGFFLVLILLVL